MLNHLPFLFSHRKSCSSTKTATLICLMAAAAVILLSGPVSASPTDTDGITYTTHSAEYCYAYYKGQQNRLTVTVWGLENSSDQATWVVCPLTQQQADDHSLGPNAFGVYY